MTALAARTSRRPSAKLLAFSFLILGIPMTSLGQVSLRQKFEIGGMGQTTRDLQSGPYHSVFGSVLIWFLDQRAASIAPLIHSDTETPFAFAATSTRFRYSVLNRRFTALDFASPLASFGRPGFRFLGLGSGTSNLLHDGHLDSGVGGCHWAHVKHRNVTFWAVEVVRFVRPRIDMRRLWMSMKLENLYGAFPYGFTIERLQYRDAINVR